MEDGERGRDRERERERERDGVVLFEPEQRGQLGDWETHSAGLDKRTGACKVVMGLDRFPTEC